MGSSHHSDPALHSDDPMHLGTIKNRVEFWRHLHVYSAANLVNFKIALRTYLSEVTSMLNSVSFDEFDFDNKWKNAVMKNQEISKHFCLK